MNYSVTVVLPNARRQKVPVKLNTPILMILEETCKKHQLNASEYELKFHNRILDLTSNIQFSGISNNAQLELTPVTKPRTETAVNIYLQLENGERLSGTFPSSHTLWDVIHDVCSEEMKSEKNPVIIYTRQEVYGDKLKTTTLKMLGLTNGKALLRLLHRTEKQLKNQSVSSVYKLPPKPKPIFEEKLGSSSLVSTVDTESKKSSAEIKPLFNPPSSSESIVSREDSKTSSPTATESSGGQGILAEESSMEIENIEAHSEPSVAPPSKIPENRPTISEVVEDTKIETPKIEKPEFNINDVQFIGDKYALIFHVDSMPSPKFNSSEDDDFYELTVEDAKTLLRDIKRTRSELEEADLETSDSKAKKKSVLLERTLSIYPYCVVRIIFPNRFVLQGVFESTESILDVITFTKTFINEFILNFYLYISPPKRILKAEETLLDIGAVPGINLYFSVDQTDSHGNQILKAEFQTKTVLPIVALEVANHFRRVGGIKMEPLETLPSTSSGTVTKPRPQFQSPADHDAAPKKLAGSQFPKWFQPQ